MELRGFSPSRFPDEMHRHAPEIFRDVPASEMVQRGEFHRGVEGLGVLGGGIDVQQSISIGCGIRYGVGTLP